MRIAFIALAVMAASPLAQAEGNGPHPAIAARRVIAAQGFDHASAFYRHPAGLSLAATAPLATKDQAEAIAARPAAAEQRTALRPASRK